LGLANENSNQKRFSLLADVAEKYYLEGKDQSEIAREVGVTRSMVSRMLTEARSRGIVEIRINRPVNSDHKLAEALLDKYGIDSVFVAEVEDTSSEHLLQVLGPAGAEVLQKHLHRDSVIGVAWGTSISAVVDAVQPVNGLAVKVTQLVGAQGAKNAEYDGHALVSRLAEKLRGEGYFLNAPCLCQTPEIASSMRETRGIRETIEMGREADIALVGIGTTETEYSSFFLSGLLTEEELAEIRQKDVVGDVAGNYFYRDGSAYMDPFLSRMITIRWEDLVRIPVRIGIAGGPGKVEAIRAALISQLVNSLVTDSVTAKQILEEN
jgi:DNA-binding transcriptional regulator LsrR (DeoR family)